MENSAKLLEHSLLVIWNDRQAERRLAAMKAVYADDIVFYESNDGPAIVGHHAINELIAKLQQQWPVEFSFALTQVPQANHDLQLISWTLGIPGQAPAASGSDIAIIKDGKIASLYLFLDIAESNAE